MATQDYATHRHNPKMTSIGFGFVLIAVVAFTLRWFDMGGRFAFAAGLSGLTLSIIVLLIISRTYTTTLQDRIIRLEMKVRAASVLAPADQATLAGLTLPQVIALRFASDAELPALVRRAAAEKLSADQIKRAITTWVGDFNRT